MRQRMGTKLEAVASGGADTEYTDAEPEPAAHGVGCVVCFVGVVCMIYMFFYILAVCSLICSNHRRMRVKCRGHRLHLQHK